MHASIKAAFLSVAILAFPGATPQEEPLRDALEPNQSFEEARKVEPGRPFTASIHPLKDVDHFAVEVAEPGFLEVAVRGVPAPVALLAKVFTKDRKEIASRQAGSGQDLFARIEVAEAGTYCLQLRDGQVDWRDPLDNQASPELMTVTLGHTPLQDSEDPGGDLEKARPVPLGEAVLLRLHPAGDVDCLRFVLPPPGHGKVTVSAADVPDNFSLRIWAYNPEKKEIASLHKEPGQGSLLTFLAAAPGEWFLQVRNEEHPAWGRWVSWNHFSSTQTFTLRVDFAPLDDAGEPNGELKSATLLEPEKPRRGRIFPPGDHDFFRLEVPATGRGILEILVLDVAPNLKPFLRLYDEAGKEIDTATRNPGMEVRWRREMQAPGIYYLLLQDAEHHNGRYWESWNDSYAEMEYSIGTRFVSVPDDGEPNDGLDSARTIPLGTPVAGALFPKGDHDFFRIAVPAPGRGALAVAVEGLPDHIAPVLRLYNAAKQEVQVAQGPVGRTLVLLRPLAGGGDFFLLLQDGEHHNGRYWEGWNDSSSAEPYRLTASFLAAPGAAGEPNDSPETAAELKPGEPAEFSLYPGGDADHFKFRVGENELGGWSARAGDFPAFMRARLTLLGPDRRPLASLSGGPGRLLLPFRVERPGEYCLQVRAQEFPIWRWISHAEQSCLEPLAIAVGREEPADPAGEKEPNGGPGEAQPYPPGKPLGAALMGKGDEDWFRLELEGPARLQVVLDPVAPDIDPEVRVFRLRGEAKAERPRILYLHGPHGEFQLDRGLTPLVEIRRVEAGSPEAKTALASPEALAGFRAVVVDALHDPADFGLGTPAVQAGLESYVEAGGRFVLLTPFRPLSLFGVELAQPGVWQEDVAVDLGPGHPLLKEALPGRLRGWDACESVGFWVKWREAGFEALHGHAGDPAGAVAVAKALGKGWIVLDTQTVGHVRNRPEAEWKLWAWIGLQPFLIPMAVINDTSVPDGQPRGRGRVETASLEVTEPGTLLFRVADLSGGEAKDGSYRLLVEAVPLALPARPSSRSAEALPVALPAGGAAEAGLSLGSGESWLRLEPPGSGVLQGGFGGAPDGIDPAISIWRLPRGEAPAGRVLYLHGGHPEFDLDRRLPGVLLDRLDAGHERAAGILRSPGALAPYAAVVVDGLRNPADFGLEAPGAEENLRAWVEAGGRFVVLSPLCRLGLFGVENREWGSWIQEGVVESYAPDPVFAGRRREDSTGGWPGAEAVGWWLHREGDGFTVLQGDGRDPNRQAVAMIRRIGKGFVGLDAQPLGHRGSAGVGEWKARCWIGAGPGPVNAGTFDWTQGLCSGGLEGFELPVGGETLLVQIRNNAYMPCLDPFALKLSFSPVERPLEPDDGPGRAVPAEPGRRLAANLFPGGDRDWREAGAPGRGALRLRVTGAPDNLDPVLELRTKPYDSKQVRVLYLEAWPPFEIDEAAFPGASITRLDATDPGAGEALQRLDGYGVVILSTIRDARQFGLDRRETHESLRRFVEAGGRCLVLRPFGCSFAENSPQMGAVLDSFSSQWDPGAWHAVHLSDGCKVAGNHGYGWCCGNGAKFPHRIVWSFPGGPRKLDRVVLHNHASSAGSRVKEFSILASDDGKEFRPAGSFTAGNHDEPQRFAFPPVECRYAAFEVASNHGHPSETQAGEVELFGPGSLDGFFGVLHAGGDLDTNVAVLSPMHWLLRRRALGSPSGWPGPEACGWWIDWEGKGFLPVLGDPAAPATKPFTLEKRLGKGWVVLDAQPLADPRFAGQGRWKLQNLLDSAPGAHDILNGTQGTAEGGDETADLHASGAASWLVGLGDRQETGNRENGSAAPFGFGTEFRADDSAGEPDDTPDRARALRPGAVVEARLFPAGDVDWLRFVVERAGTLKVFVREVPAVLDPQVTVYRAGSQGARVRVLYLACRPETDLDRRDWPPGLVSFTRVEAGSAEAALDRLPEHDVAVLDGPTSPLQFGLDRKETLDRILRWVEGGGRFLVLGPACSFSLASPGAGGGVAAWSSAWDLGKWHPANLADGYWQPDNNLGGWCSGDKAPFPHWILFRLGGGESKTVDRMVIWNTAQRPEACAREVELLGAERNEEGAFRSLGKFALEQGPGPQELRFGPARCAFLRLVILSNHGHPNETQLGEVEFFEPGGPEGLFGVRLVPSGRDGDTVAAVLPDHWIASKRARGNPNGWPGWESRGWFTGWEKEGFEAVYADREDLKGRAVTLCRHLGKGWLALDAQELGLPGRDGPVAWKLRNYLDLPEAPGTPFNGTQGAGRGGPEEFSMPVTPGAYFLRLSDTEPWRWSLEKMRVTVEFEPVETPFEPGDRPDLAAWLLPGRPVRTTIFPRGDVDWFRLSAAEKTVLRVELSGVPDNLDPQVDLFAAGDPARPVGSFNGTQGGGRGFPEMFSVPLPAAGEWLLKVQAVNHENASPVLLLLRADFAGAGELGPPRLWAGSLAEGLEGASLRPPLLWNADRPLAEESLKPDAFEVRGSRSGLLPGKISWDPEKYQVAFTLERDLLPGETVTATAREGLAATGGAGAPAGTRLVFTTAGAAGPAGKTVVSIKLQPASPLGAGGAALQLTPANPLPGTPELSFRPSGGAPVPVALSPDGKGGWTGRLAIRPDTPNGSAAFELRGAGEAEILEGRIFEIDTQAPAAMGAPTALPAPGGRVRLRWARPREAADLEGYRVYRSRQEAPGAGAASLVKAVFGADATSLEDLTPEDGEWFYLLSAVDRAGNEGGLSPGARVASDRQPPSQALPGLEAAVAKPRVGLSWRPSAEEGVAGWSLFRFPAGAPSPSLAGAAPLAELPVERTSLEDSPGDGRFVYAIAPRDAAGNLGPPARSPEVVVDTRQASARVILPGEPPYPPGEYKLGIELDEPLASPPVLTLRLADGKTRRLEVKAAGERRWEALARFTAEDPDGDVAVLMDGVDLHGNQGIRVAAGGGFYLDTGPPKAWIRTDPPGHARAGTTKVTVDFGEDVEEGPSLSFELRGQRREIPIKRIQGRRFGGELEVGPDGPDGKGRFTIVAADRFGHKGGTIVEGGELVVDTRPPDAPLRLAARPGPGGTFRITWLPPGGEGVRHFRLYGAPEKVAAPGPDRLLADGIRTEGFEYAAKGGEAIWFTVTAVDLAGNEGPPAAWVKAAADSTPPAAPAEPAVALEAGGRLGLSWKPPAPEENIRYNVYRATSRLESLSGQRPILEGVRETKALDDPRQTAVYYYWITALDEAGNESPPAAAPPFDFDVEPPTAAVSLSPLAGRRWFSVSRDEGYPAGLLAAGEKEVLLTASEPLAGTPVLLFRTRTMVRPVPVALEPAGAGWRGRVAVPEKGEDGVLSFSFEGTDRKGNRGTVIPKGRGDLFLVDTTPPDPVVTLALKALPGGKVGLSWGPPPGERSDELRYNVYRSTSPIKDLAGLKPLVAAAAVTELLDDPGRDGELHYAVVAVDGAGNPGGLFESRPVASDRTPPPPASGLKAEARGEVRLSWQPSGEAGATYTVLRNGTPVARDLLETAFADAPGQDGAFDYAVLAIDRAGNQSAPAGPARIEFRDTAPAADLATEPASPLRSSFRATLRSSQPLQAPPDLFLQTRQGGSVKVALEPADGEGKVWSGAVHVAPAFGDGEAKFVVGMVSREGVKGSRIASGGVVVLDTRPPRAAVILEPRPPAGAGRLKVRLRPDEPLREAPRLSCTTMGAPARAVALKPDGDEYTGELEIGPGDGEGIAFFEFAGLDLAGNEGTGLEGARFLVDLTPPKAPSALAAKPIRDGFVELTWEPPAYAATETPERLAWYNIYCDGKAVASLDGLKPLLARAAQIPCRVRPERDGAWWFAVTAVDTAGHESPPSGSAACTSSRTPPEPPRITALEPAAGSIRLSWEAGGDAASFRVLALPPGARDFVPAGSEVREKTFTYMPLRGGNYLFKVVALDRLGHESVPSTAAALAFEQKAPLAAIRLAREGPLGIGRTGVTLEATKPLVRAPVLRFLSEGSPAQEVPLQGEGTLWKGELALDAPRPGKAGRFQWEGAALAEGKEVPGSLILDGETAALDFEGPVLSLELGAQTPRAGERALLKAGEHPFRARVSEPLSGEPALSFTPRGGQPVPLRLARLEETLWSGILPVDSNLGDGPGLFEWSGIDLRGNKGDVIAADRNVEIDTLPPAGVARIRAVPLPGGKVRVEWTAPLRPDGTPDVGAGTFKVFRSDGAVTDATGLAPHRVVERTLGFLDEPGVDREWFYAVLAVDRAGNEGPLSGCASARVDKTAPAPPRDLRVTQLDTGAVKLSWQPPEGEAPLFYNVYLEERPIVSTLGLAPRSKGITWTEIYGTPNENGKYWFAVTAVDGALNESGPGNCPMLDFKAVPPLASFRIEPDIWLSDGEHRVVLATSEELAEPPLVLVNAESGARRPLPFSGSGNRWTATLTVTPEMPEGTYGFLFKGRDRDGNTGEEVLEGPLFHVDRSRPLPPGELAVEPDTRGTPGAVILRWVTPKRKERSAEVPHGYNIYRSATPIASLRGLRPVGTVKVVYENIDDYDHTDVPPEDGTWHYAVTSLDLARNESEPSNVFRVEVSSAAPRASLELLVGTGSPAGRDADGIPKVGKGRVRAALVSSAPLREAPALSWHLEGEEGQAIPVPLAGSGARWEGEFSVDRELEETATAFFRFSGISAEGVKGSFIRQGGEFRIDTKGPVAEIVIPSVYTMKVQARTNTLEVPPVRPGSVEVVLTADEELASPPRLAFRLDGGEPVPVPMAGFGREWRGFMAVPEGLQRAEGRFEWRGVDRAGNVSTAIAKRRYPYRVNDEFPPRKIESYATTGGVFSVDGEAPPAPSAVQAEMRKLGVAVVKWQPPEGDPAAYRLYRALTPITDLRGLKPVKAGIFAPVIVDDPPVDGRWFYAVTAEDLAGNESPLSGSESVFIDTIKPELKIQAVPSGDDLVVLMDENEPEEISLTLRFPGQKEKTVRLGGSSGELKEYPRRRMPDGRQAVVFPQLAELFNGRVEVVVNSPDPDGNVVERITEVEFKQISAATGGEVESPDGQVQLEIPPGLKPVIPKGIKEEKRVGGYENLFFIQYANIPEEKPAVPPGQPRPRDQVDPLPPGLEVVGKPYVVQMNLAPEEPLQLKGSATQADLTQLTKLVAKLRMKIPVQYSDAVADPEYLKTRLKVVKWVPGRSDEKPGRWELVPDIEVDVKKGEIITPANDITTYAIICERTPPSIRELQPGRDSATAAPRPEISCLIVDKGTGVAVGAENRIAIYLDGVKVEERFLEIGKGDPTEVRVAFRPREDLAPGPHVAAVRAEDVVENVAIVKWRFTVDNRPPAIAVLSPAPGSRLPVGRPLLQVRVEDEGGIDPAGTALFLDGIPVPVERITWDSATGLLGHSFPAELPSGRHKVELTVRDKGGLESKNGWEFSTDLAPPAASVTGLDPGKGELRFVLRDELGEARLLELRLDGERVPSAAAEGGEGYSFSLETGAGVLAGAKAFAPGRRRLEALFADDLGNAGAWSWEYSVTRDEAGRLLAALAGGPPGAPAPAGAPASRTGPESRPGQVPPPEETPAAAPSEGKGLPLAWILATGATILLAAGLLLFLKRRR